MQTIECWPTRMRENVEPRRTLCFALNVGLHLTGKPVSREQLAGKLLLPSTHKSFISLRAGEYPVQERT